MQFNICFLLVFLVALLVCQPFAARYIMGPESFIQTDFGNKPKTQGIVGTSDIGQLTV